jgi:hypothetical protein
MSIGYEQLEGLHILLYHELLDAMHCCSHETHRRPHLLVSRSVRAGNSIGYVPVIPRSSTQLQTREYHDTNPD